MKITRQFDFEIAPPFRKIEFDILYNRGVSKEGELLDLGMKAGVVLRSGTWYSMKHPSDGEIRIGQGMERSRQFLIDNPDLAEVIEAEIRTKFAPAPDPHDTPAEADAPSDEVEAQKAPKQSDSASKPGEADGKTAPAKAGSGKS